MKHESHSPFAYDTDERIRKIHSDVSPISVSRVWDLVTGGQVNETERLIIQLVYELDYLTANQIQQCFMKDGIPPELKRVSISNGKNPYCRCLNHLESLGIITAFGIFKGLRQVGIRIYGLSNGAQKWMQDQGGRYQNIFYKQISQRRQDLRNLDPTFCQTEQILGKLARNQYHIRAVNTYHTALKAYSPFRYLAGPLDVAYYQTNAFGDIYLIPIREAPYGHVHLLEALSTLSKIIKNNDKIPSSCIIIAAESLGHTKRIHRLLYGQSDLQKIMRFYSTDTFAKEECFVFENLLHYFKYDTAEYEMVSLDPVALTKVSQHGYQYPMNGGT